jgi:release factor glutamine methyltransferase
MAVKLQTIDDSKRVLTDGLKDIYPLHEAAAVASYLIESVTGRSHLQQLTGRTDTITHEDGQRLMQGLSALQRGEPVQYVAGYAWFMGKKFSVNPGVLIPRQETEELVELTVKKAGSSFNGTIIDFCTGSGCIAASLADRLPEAKLVATDISLKALETAATNFAALKADVTIVRHDLLGKDFSNLPNASVIVANPPYVRHSEKVLMEPMVTLFEPAEALFVSDDNPLIFYSALLESVEQLLVPGGWFCFEINEALGNEMMGLFSVPFVNNPAIIDDINSKNRFIAGTRA